MLNYSELNTKSELKEVVAHLDNLYVQIKIHHENGRYRQAAELFSEVHISNKKVNQLQSKLKIHKAKESLRNEGISVEVVKKSYETMAVD